MFGDDIIAECHQDESYFDENGDPIYVDDGAVYVYDSRTGAFKGSFVNPEPQNEDHFGGGRVRVQNGKVLIQALQDAGSPFDSGVLHVFDGTNRTLLQTFRNPTPGEEDHFGGKGAFLGENILVSSPSDDFGGIESSGAVYLFNSSDAQLIRTIGNPDPVRYGHFRAQIEVIGGLVAISANWNYVGSVPGAGVVYLFDATTLELVRTIANPTPEVNELFGERMYTWGDGLLVGAIQDNIGGYRAGAVYLFDPVTGELLHTYPNPTPQDGDCFGHIWTSSAKTS